MNWIKLHTRTGALILVNLSLASDILWDEADKVSIIYYPFHNPLLEEQETYHLKVKETPEEIMALI